MKPIDKMKFEMRAKDQRNLLILATGFVLGAHLGLHFFVSCVLVGIVLVLVQEVGQ